MASYDRKFEVLLPTLDKLSRLPVEVADPRLLDPTNQAVVPLCDGELLMYNSAGKLVRATDATAPAFFSIEDRGDYGVQVTRKVSILQCSHFTANTIMYAADVTTLHQALMAGTVNTVATGSVNRVGLIAHTGSNRRLGFVLKLPAINKQLLQFYSVMA